MVTRVLIYALVLVCAIGITQTLRLHAATARAAVADLRVEALVRATAEWEASTYALSVSLATCQEQWNDVRLRGNAALAQAQRQRDIARDALGQWRARWDARAADCGAALAATDGACAALEGY